jgi:type I restriction enzyme S subunit
MEEQLIPQLRFPEFSKNWEIKYIKNIAKVVGGGTPSTTNTEYWNGEINWFTPTEIKFDIVSESKRKITDLGLIKSSATIIPKGTILLTTRATIGEVAIAQEECTTNQGFQSLVVNKNNSNQFVFDLIKVYRKELYKRANGSTFKEISKKEVEKIKVLIPKLPEQQKIASFLTDIDEVITKLTKKKTLLEQYKKGVMQKIFNQELRFKDDDGNEFPNWVEKKLGEVATKQSSNISANTIEENFGEYKIYGASGLLKKIDFYREEEPYISIVKDGAGVGRTLLCDAYSSVLGTLDIIKPKQGVNLYFIYCLLNNLNFLKFITGSTIPHIYFKDYSTVKINIPSLAEQTKIANFLSDIDVKIEALNTKTENSKTFKKGLLQQMFV